MATAIFYIATLYPPFTIVLILSGGFSRVFLDQLLTGYNPTWLMPFIHLSIAHTSVSWRSS